MGTQSYRPDHYVSIVLQVSLNPQDMDALLPRHPSTALEVVTFSPGPAALCNVDIARHSQPLRAFDSKAEALNAVPLDTWKAQPVDRNPATSAAADGCAPTAVGLRSWQFAVTGKLAAAQVLADLEVKHITNGEAAEHQL